MEIADNTACIDRAVPTTDRLSLVITKLLEKDLLWKMGYDSWDNEKIMNASSSEISDFNLDFAHTAFTVKDYWKDFRPDTRNTRSPVLFFYGKRDWIIGPTHYIGVHFPRSIMWPSDVVHVASLENKSDLEKAIDTYKGKYGL